MDYVDLHSHILWGLDDGARNLADAMEMLRLLSDMGFTQVYATPHQKEGSFTPSEEAISQRYAETASALAADSSLGSPLSLHIAAENFWDALFLSRSQTDSQPAYRQAPTHASSRRTSAFLFELPLVQLPPRFEEQLFQLRLRGRLPVLAHPERYAAYWKHWDRLANLSRTTALVVDLGALSGAHGPERCKAARHIVAEGLCHAAASDVHQPEDLPSVAEGILWIKKKLGTDRLRHLLSEGPRQILCGELPDLH